MTVPASCRCLYLAGDSPLSFYVQLTNNEAEITQISEMMYEQYSEAAAEQGFEPERKGTYGSWSEGKPCPSPLPPTLHPTLPAQ